MAKAMMVIEETVIIEYELHYDEEELKRIGYTSLEDYLARFNGNVWKAQNEEDIVIDISHNQIIEYMKSHYDTMEITNS